MVTPPELPDVNDFLPPTPDKVVCAAKDLAGVLIKNAPPAMIVNAINAIHQDATGFAEQLAANVETLSP
ncbi:hypothetical protein ES703_123568 [subsurface metagenome]